MHSTYIVFFNGMSTTIVLLKSSIVPRTAETCNGFQKLWLQQPFTMAGTTVFTSIYSHLSTSSPQSPAKYHLVKNGTDSRSRENHKYISSRPSLEKNYCLLCLCFSHLLVEASSSFHLRIFIFSHTHWIFQGVSLKCSQAPIPW